MKPLFRDDVQVAHAGGGGFIEEDCDGAVAFRLGKRAFATAAISDVVGTTTPMGFPSPPLP
ncbi:MAG: hypothetical protein WBW73_22195 [Rhodoplanes sp.]